MDTYFTYFTRPETVFEIVKTLAQLFGAIFIAKLAVGWALARFKSEKAWERETVALADVLIALSELTEINYHWMREYEESPYTREFHSTLHNRTVLAKAKLLSVSAVASLVLNSDLYAAFDQFAIRLNQTFENDEPHIDFLVREAELLNTARTTLLSVARIR